MICHKCTKKTDYTFCDTCNPKYGDVVYTRYNQAVFLGVFHPIKAIKALLKGKELVRWWVGTDALRMHMHPPGLGKLTTISMRLVTRLFERFIAEHWVNGRGLIKDLTESGLITFEKIKITYWAGNFKVYEKKPHEGFNIAYYAPRNDTFARWVYGLDIVEELIKSFPDLNWIKLDGTKDMAEIYPILDLYIRPSRHDGWPRLTRECELNKIPIITGFSYNDQFGEILKACIQHIGFYTWDGAE